MMVSLGETYKKMWKTMENPCFSREHDLQMVINRILFPHVVYKSVTMTTSGL